MMTSYILHCFCTYCMKNTGAYYIFSIIVAHSVLSGTTVLKARPKV